MKKKLFSSIPKIDEVLMDEKISKLIESIPRDVVVEVVREETAALRSDIVALDKKNVEDFEFSYDKYIEKIISKASKNMDMKLRRVINATGVVLHTNMGRAILSEAVMDRIKDVAINYSNLELNLETGKRGSRYSHLEDLVAKLTGAEAALVVNNNAAAVLLVLNTLSLGKEAIVSRGELVEIGGSFRVPEVMKMGGADLVEIGTTNKTHPRDYERAITEDTGVILKVHTSNYKILGFTKEVEVDEIAEIAKKHDVPFVEDIGSGCLVDFGAYGLEKEPLVSESIEKGADIVTFSGDKLLGGPQAGIIVGKKVYIDQMKANQLTRALRVDKFTLSALEATFRTYLDKEKAVKEIPVLRMLTMTKDEIALRAASLRGMLAQLESGLTIELIDGSSEVGGGSKPLEQLPTKLLAIKSSKMSTNRVWTELKDSEMPIMARINEDTLLIDVRTVKDSEFEIIRDAFKEISC